MAAPIERLDVPLPVVEAQARTLSGSLAEQRHTLDTADGLFAQLATDHGDCCSTDATYPDWTCGGQA